MYTIAYVHVISTRLYSICTGGVDYGPFSNPILRLPALLPANDTRVTFYVPLMDDNIVEDTETFRVTLESLDSSVFVVGIHSTVVSIEDDDGTFNRITLTSIIIIWRMSHLN